MMTKRDPSLTTIEIKKEVARLAHAYCVINEMKMKEFVSQVMQEHLSGFNDRLKELGEIESDG